MRLMVTPEHRAFYGARLNALDHAETSLSRADARTARWNQILSRAVFAQDARQARGERVEWSEPEGDEW